MSGCRGEQRHRARTPPGVGSPAARGGAPVRHATRYRKLLTHELKNVWERCNRHTSQRFDGGFALLLH